MSDAVRTQIGIVEETTPGTTPATPAFETLRVTAANLKTNKTLKSSQELRSDRLVTDRVTLGFEAGGDIPQEVSYGAVDTNLRGAMQSEWVWAAVRDNNGTADSNVTDVTATDITVIASNATQFRYGTVKVGHLVRTSGFTNAGNNTLRRASAGTTDTDLKLAGGTIEAAPPAAARVKVVGFEGAAGDINSTATGLASTALDFTALNLAVGMWVWVGGGAAGQQFATAGVAGWCRISAIAAAALTFDVKPSTWAVDNGAAKTIRVFVGDYIRTGTTQRSYSIEQQFQDLTAPTYEYYKGMTISAMEFTVQQREILTCKTTFMGMSVADPSVTRFTGATDVAAPTNDVMEASDNVGTILVNGAAVGGNYVTSMTLNIDNSGRYNTAVGSRYAVAVKIGEAVITGKLDTYYADSTVLAFIRNSTAVGFFFPISDSSATKAYLFDCPRVKLGQGDPTVPGINQDRMLSTDYQALRHPTLGYALHIQRLEEYGT